MVEDLVHGPGGGAATKPRSTKPSTTFVSKRPRAHGKRPVAAKQENPDVQFFRRLPTAAKADIDAARQRAEDKALLASTGGNIGFLVRQGRDDPHRDLLDTNPTAYVAAHVHDAVEKYRQAEAKLKTEAPARVRVAAMFGQQKSEEQVQQEQFRKLGTHNETLLEAAGKVLNIPFSAAGNLYARRPGEALKNLVGRGRQTTIGSEMFGPGTAKAAAADFLTAFVGTPELSFVKSAAGTAAARVASKGSAKAVLRAARYSTPEDAAVTRILTEPASPGGPVGIPSRPLTRAETPPAPGVERTIGGARPKLDYRYTGPNLLTREPRTPVPQRALEDLPYLPASAKGGEQAIREAVAARAAVAAAKEAPTPKQLVRMTRRQERSRTRRAGAEAAFQRTLSKFGRRGEDLAPTPDQLAKSERMFGATHVAEPGASLPRPSGKVGVRPEYDLGAYADELQRRAEAILKPYESDIRAVASGMWQAPGGRFLTGVQKDQALRSRGYRQTGASARGKNIPGKTLEDYYPAAVKELTAAGRADIAEAYSQADELVSRAIVARRELQGRTQPEFIGPEPATLIEGEPTSLAFAPRRQEAVRSAEAARAEGATPRQLELAQGLVGKRPRRESAQLVAKRKKQEGIDLAFRVLGDIRATPAQRELAFALLRAPVPVERAGRTGAAIPRPRPGGLTRPELARREAVAQSTFGPPEPRTIAITDTPPLVAPAVPSVGRVRATPSEFLGPAGGRLAAARAEEAATSGALEQGVASSVKPAQAVQAGQALEQAEAKLRRIGERVYSAPPKPAPKAAEATTGQRLKFLESFKGSDVEDLITAALDMEQARQAARQASASGIRVAAPFTRMRSGVDIPLFPAKLRNRIGQFKSVKWLQHAVDAWDHAIVSSYGPNPLAATAARHADHWVSYANSQALDWIIRRSKAFNIKERQAAVRYLEGTVRKRDDKFLTPEVKAFADELAGYVEHLTDQFVQAGGKIQRMRDQYVYHTMPPDQWARFQREFGGSDETVFGTTAKFSKHRSNPTLTIQALKDLGYDPLDDLAAIVYARAAAHNRAMADMGLIRVLQRHSWDAAEGLAPASREVGERFGVPPAAYADKAVMLPFSVNETLQRVQEARNVFSRNALVRGFQDVNSRWKTLALLTTGYDVRNQIGDMILVAQAGHNPITAIGRGLAALAAESGGAGRSAAGRAIAPLTSRLREGGVSYDTLANAAAMLGVSRTGTLFKEVKSHLGEAAAKDVPSARKQILTSPVRAGQKIRRERENVNRAGLFAGLTKGEGPLLAGERARNVLYDYGDVGWLTNALRRNPFGAPFVSWLVKNIPAQVRHHAARPRNILLANQLQQFLLDESGNPPDFMLSPFARKQLPIAIPGRGFVTFGAPQSDLNRFSPLLRGQFGELARDTLSNAGPATQGVLGTAGGINPLTFSQIPDRVAATGADKVIRSMLPLIGDVLLGPEGDYVKATDAAGKKIGVPAVSGRGSFLLRQLNPALSTYGRLAGDPGRARAALDLRTVRDITTGLRIYPFNDPRELVVARNRNVAIILEQRRKLRAHVGALKLAGVHVDRKRLEGLDEYKKIAKAVEELRVLKDLIRKQGGGE